MSLDLVLRIGAVLAAGFQGAIGAAMRSVQGVEAATQRLQAGWGGLAAGAGTLAGIGKTITAAADLESLLNDIRITGDMSQASMVAMGATLRDLSVPTETNQSVTDLGHAVQDLVAGGMAPDKAIASVRTIGRTATATKSDIVDLSKTTGVLIDTLGITPDGLPRAMDMLATAGKQGKFELKDMASYFPVLGAQARTMGLQGTEAIASMGAALQIAMKGAGTQGEAANNFNNFMAKIQSPEVLKNFQDRGVNLTKVMADAMASGQNPMEVVLAKIDSLLGSDQAKRGARLGALFGDMQVQNFLRPMLANMPEYYRIKEVALQAAGTVEADYATRMDEANETMNAASHAAQNLATAVGGGLARAWAAVLKPVTPVLTFLAEVASKSPVTTMAILGLGSALVLLPPVFTLVAVAWQVMSASMMATGIGAAIAVLAIGAALIIDNWTPISEFFSKMWTGIGEVWEDAISKIMALWDRMARPIAEIKAFLGLKSDSKSVNGQTPSDKKPPGIQESAVPQVQAKPGSAMPPAPTASPGQAGQQMMRATAQAAQVAQGSLPQVQRKPGDAMPGQTSSVQPKPGSALPPAPAAPPGQAGQRMMSVPPPAPSSAAAQPAVSHAAQPTRVEVLVRFANAPSGTSVQSRSSDDKVRVSASVGPAMAGVN